VRTFSPDGVALSSLAELYLFLILDARDRGVGPGSLGGDCPAIYGTSASALLTLLSGLLYHLSGVASWVVAGLCVAVIPLAKLRSRSTVLRTPVARGDGSPPPGFSFAQTNGGPSQLRGRVEPGPPADRENPHAADIWATKHRALSFLS